VLAPEPIRVESPPLTGRAVASQRWSDVAFVHWRVPAQRVAPLLPGGLRPDVYDGSSWVGLIPFVLDRATIFGSPPIPWFGDFVEINVRLYAVDTSGRRGVVFLTLEANRLAAVLAARVVFGLPYRWARTRLEATDGRYRYTGARHGRTRARTEIVVRPGAQRVVGDGLADFLTARWALFTTQRGTTVHLRNTHEPWPLFTATLEGLDDGLLADSGFADLASRPPDSVLFSPGVTTWFSSTRIVCG
jgi:uncharacterized protein YqjF (DUF2071 family)